MKEPTPPSHKRHRGFDEMGPERYPPGCSGMSPPNALVKACSCSTRRASSAPLSFTKYLLSLFSGSNGSGVIAMNKLLFLFYRTMLLTAPRLRGVAVARGFLRVVARPPVPLAARA